MQVGYVRVSTNEQNTALQRDALERSGCELIFEDKISGKSTNRPGLNRALRQLNAGDTLVVWKLDRLGRSMRHLVSMTEELRQRGVNFRSLTDSIDTSTPMGRFFFHIMGRSCRNGTRVNRRTNPRRAGCSPGTRQDRRS
ncbi:DNA-invertase [Escherichia coli]|nr:DNA-invertase [Escherichia coli]